MLKDFAFHVVGTDDDARELDRDHGIAQVSLAQARATGSWRHRRRAAEGAPPAPRRGHGRHRGARRRRPRRARRGQRPGPDRIPRRRPELGRPGRRADQPPVFRPVRPARRSRTASPRSSAARRDSSSAKGSARSAGWSATRRDGRTGSSGRTPTASPSRRTRRARRSRSGSCRGTTTRTSAGRTRPRSGPRPTPCATSWAGSPRASTGRPTTSSCTRRPVARAGRRHLPLALGDPPATARDRGPRAGNRSAGQPRLARGRGRGAARPRRRSREVERVELRRARGGRASQRGWGARHMPCETAMPMAHLPRHHPLGASVVIDRTLTDLRDPLGHPAVLGIDRGLPHERHLGSR